MKTQKGISGCLRVVIFPQFMFTHLGNKFAISREGRVWGPLSCKAQGRHNLYAQSKASAESQKDFIVKPFHTGFISEESNCSINLALAIEN